jgi:ComF family protein
MSIFNNLIAIFAPYECLGCNTEGRLLCAACVGRLTTIPERCYRCRKLSPNGLTCLVCRKSSRLYRVRPAVVYEGVAKELTWKLKFAGAQSAARYMARCMVQGLSDEPGVLIVPVPTATSRVRQRGYDQAVLIAREVARQTGLHYAACLARGTQTHQVGSGREQRLRQLAGAFRVSQPRLVQGAHIILIDDVLTTGATLEAAAATLQAAGSRQIDALTFTQA